MSTTRDAQSGGYLREGKLHPGSGGDQWKLHGGQCRSNSLEGMGRN